MGYIAPVSQEEALKGQPAAQEVEVVEDTPAEELGVVAKLVEKVTKKSTKKSAE